MLAQIYQPARTAMQSGQANSRDWVLEFTPASPRFRDPLMGWTGSSDTQTQVKMRFDTKEAAIAYAERNGIPYQLREPKKRAHILRQNGYGDNFAHARRAAWTH